jgi:hypothetical protein
MKKSTTDDTPLVISSSAFPLEDHKEEKRITQTSNDSVETQQQQQWLHYYLRRLQG